jgi:hypothetical protein
MRLLADEALVQSRIGMRNGKLFDLLRNVPVALERTNRIWTIKECQNPQAKARGSREITLPTQAGSHKPVCQRREDKVIDWLCGNIATLN